MSTQIGALNVRSLAAGYWFTITENGPDDWVAEVTGQRVLIPGTVGEYTTADAFEARRLPIRYHGIVMGDGATHDLAVASFTARMDALKAACGVSTRADVTLLEGAWTAQAGFIRFEGPSASAWGGEARELDIVFEATDPPEWTAS